jgi:asparaginyl-tRNA synthetase
MDYFKKTKISKINKMEKDDINQEDVIILGWIRTKREMKTFSFVEINDGSTVQNIQVIVDHDKGFPVEQLKTGASVRIKGKLNYAEGRKQKFELIPTEVTLVGECPDDFPMQKKRHSFDYLREVAHLRPRTNAFGVMNRFRSKMSFACHKFFQEKGFFYVNTPLISTNDCEGAGELFKVTTLDLNNLPMENGAIDYTKDFFAEEAGLTVSGQLEGEIMACALGDIYTFGPTFRAENSNTTRHLSEFWMLEPEMAFCDLLEDVKVATEFLKYIFRYALENCPEEMNFFNSFVEKGISDIYKHNDAFVVVNVSDILPKTYKTFDEAKGKIINAFQNHKEENWLKKLATIYSVTVNEGVLAKVKSQIQK